MSLDISFDPDHMVRKEADPTGECAKHSLRVVRFLTNSGFESPKRAFSPTLQFILEYQRKWDHLSFFSNLGKSVKLEQKPFWGFQGQKW